MWVAVVADECVALLTAAALVLEEERNTQRGHTVVVVGEEWNLEAAAVEETTAVALGTGPIGDYFDAVVEHVDAVVRQLVFVLEVDAKQLTLKLCNTT